MNIRLKCHNCAGELRRESSVSDYWRCDKCGAYTVAFSECRITVPQFDPCDCSGEEMMPVEET